MGGDRGILFAVHPVHVEAVANVVGHSELLCTGFVLGAVPLTLEGVAIGFSPWSALASLHCALLAAISKEQGFVTPALLLVAARSPARPQAGRPPESRCHSRECWLRC